MAPGLKTASRSRIAKVMRSEVDVEKVVAEHVANGEPIIHAKKARNSNLEDVEMDPLAAVVGLGVRWA